ncbi:MAG: T9SS type A sorting domain-containing protein [Bacteroidota bacterium]
MRLNYSIGCFLLCLFALSSVQAQRTVNIPAMTGNFVDIFPIIMGDTTASGDRVDENTIYTLDNGGVYITTGRIVNKKNWPLQIKATDLSNTDLKPVLTRVPNATGTYPDIMRPEGDVTLTNIWIISGEKGPGENHDWGKIRILGDSTTFRATDCIIEKDRGGFVQLRANNVKCFINNCVLRNGGNRFILEGNGRGVDSRNFVFDTLIVRNSIIHNIVDRVFRSQGGTAAHGYIAFDNNTIFNVAGRHGCFQLRWVESARITNNLMINPMMLGTTPALTDEQNQPDNEAHKIVTLDTLTPTTELFIANNNIYWTQDVVDVWALHDSVDRPAILSDLVKDALGADTTNAFFEEVISLNNVPINITQYIEDLYADPAATDMFDFIVQDSAFAGGDRDFGNLFKFSEFDPCYDENSASASAATHGGSIGYTLGCQGLTIPDEFGTGIEDLNQNLGLKAAPNPFRAHTEISFELSEPGAANLRVFDISGRVVSTLANDYYAAGQHSVNWQAKGLGAGIYFLKLETKAGFMTQKVIIQ